MDKLLSKREQAVLSIVERRDAEARKRGGKSVKVNLATWLRWLAEEFPGLSFCEDTLRKCFKRLLMLGYIGFRRDPRVNRKTGQVYYRASWIWLRQAKALPEFLRKATRTLRNAVSHVAQAFEGVGRRKNPDISPSTIEIVRQPDASAVPAASTDQEKMRKRLYAVAVQAGFWDQRKGAVSSFVEWWKKSHDDGVDYLDGASAMSRKFLSCVAMKDLEAFRGWRAFL